MTGLTTQPGCCENFLQIIQPKKPLMKNSVKKVKDVYDHVYYYYYHYVYDEQYDNEDNVMNNQNLSRFLRCENERALMFDYPETLAYKWNGLPVHSDLNKNYETLVPILFILCGLLIITLSVSCIFLLKRNATLSKYVKFLFIFDECCKISTAIIDFYSASCVLTWHCVKTDGFLPGILVNQILNAVFSEKSEFINHGFSVIRLFAIIFDGNFYSFAERCCIPYCIFVFFFVSFLKGIQINRSPLSNTGYVCYAGYYFSPLDFINVLEYEGNSFLLQLNVILAITSLVVMGMAFLSDLFMIWKVRKFGTSDQKRRAFIRLTILLTSTNLIWAAYNFLEVDYILQFRFFAFLTDGAPPFIVFIVYEANHVLGNSISSLVTIFFSWPTRKERAVKTSTIITRSSLHP